MSLSANGWDTDAAGTSTFPLANGDGGNDGGGRGTVETHRCPFCTHCPLFSPSLL